MDTSVRIKTTNYKGTTYLSFPNMKAAEKALAEMKKNNLPAEIVPALDRTPHCPDCGREMETRDGGTPYCEYCEG